MPHTTSPHISPVARPREELQAIEPGRSVALCKSLETIPLARGALVAVRKRPPCAATPSPPVVLVHGYAQNRYSWHGSYRSLTAYLAARGFDVWNLDLRGVGRSAALGAPRARSLSEHVGEDLPRTFAAVRERTGAQRVFLVGHSLGAFVAYAYAGRHPERVRGVAALAGIYRFATRSPALRLAARLVAPADVRPSVRRSLLPARVPTDWIGRALHRTRALWDSPLGGAMPIQAWAPGAMEPEVLEEAVRRSFEPASRGVTLELARLARGETLCDPEGLPWLAPFERQRSVPLLAIAGHQDRLVAPADVRVAVQRAATPDRTFRCVGERGESGPWGHMDLLLGRDAPRHVWPVLGDWLQSR